MKLLRGISIHAPREGGDTGTTAKEAATTIISIHAPREGGDRGSGLIQAFLILISIHAPREGGDPEPKSSLPFSRYFNPRPPRGGRPDCIADVLADTTEISIHAPREGGDNRMDHALYSKGISIHAPREGGDGRVTVSTKPPPYFNPRPPRGGRLSPSGQRSEILAISIHAPREGGDTALVTTSTVLA